MDTDYTGRGAVVAVRYPFDEQDERSIREYIAADYTPEDAVRQVVQDAIGHTGAQVMGPS